MEKHVKLSIIVIFILVLISLATQYYGHIDVQEYVSVSKFFAGNFQAKIRASHSLLYSFITSPLTLIKSLFLMKLASLFFLILIIISIYYISKKDKRVLFLMLVSPVVWYMAPWISPIQIASLLFLWTYFFIERYDQQQKYKYIIYSGLLLGLATAFWSTVIFVAFFLTLCFFFNRNLNHLFIFLFFCLVGYLPVLIMDTLFYRFPFYTMIKFLTGTLTILFYGSIYQGITIASHSILRIIIFLIMIPFFSYNLFSKSFFSKHKRQVILLLLTFLFFLFNPQIRYILIFLPVLILLLTKSLNKRQFRIQVIMFLILTLITINPYIIQIKYSMNTPEFSSLISNFGKWKIVSNNEKIMLQDLEQIIKEYPNEIFVVGNKPDDYSVLAFLYWGKNVKEFVSIQDYNLFFQNNDILFEKTITSKPRIWDRRQIFISGGIKKSSNDNTDYNSIKFGISLNQPLELEDFKLIEKYQLLYFYEKT